MLTHRNLIYAVVHLCRGGRDRRQSRSRSVSYLPLCHVAERCYSEVMQLVLGGTVSFAESIDTVALNIREIAPTFFVGVPRIYEKLQQNFLFRLGESGRLRQRFVEGLFRLGPQIVGPAAERDRLPGSTASATRCSTSCCSATSSAISGSPAAVTASAPAPRSRRRRCASSTSSAARCRRAMD